MVGFSPEERGWPKRSEITIFTWKCVKKIQSPFETNSMFFFLGGPIEKVGANKQFTRHVSFGRA